MVSSLQAAPTLILDEKKERSPGGKTRDGKVKRQEARRAIDSDKFFKPATRNGKLDCVNVQHRPDAARPRWSQAETRRHARGLLLDRRAQRS